MGLVEQVLRACRAMSLNCSIFGDIATRPMYGVP